MLSWRTAEADAFAQGISCPEQPSRSLRLQAQALHFRQLFQALDDAPGHPMLTKQHQALCAQSACAVVVPPSVGDHAQSVEEPGDVDLITQRLLETQRFP